MSIVIFNNDEDFLMYEKENEKRILATVHHKDGKIEVYYT